VNYLSDTHIFLWVLFSPQKISPKLKKIFLDGEEEKHISSITFWEISLKFGLGKMELKGVLPEELLSIAKDTGFIILNPDAQILSSFYRLPKSKNKDPFDRLLAWQALQQNFCLLTADKGFMDYKDHGLKIILN